MWLPISCSCAAQLSLRLTLSSTATPVDLLEQGIGDAAHALPCAGSAPNLAARRSTEWSRKSVWCWPDPSMSCNSPWRKPPLACSRRLMPSSSNSARNTLKPPPMMGLRSSRMPARRSRSVLCAASSLSCNQSRPSRVTEPAGQPAATSTSTTALMVPAEP